MERPTADRRLAIGRRADGGEAPPTIVRWFETWATAGRVTRRR